MARVPSSCVLKKLAVRPGSARSSSWSKARSRAARPSCALADRISAVFVPVVVLIAIATFVLWWKLGPQPSLAYGLINAVAVLIIACPCSLGLATPMAVTVGIGRAAQLGVLIKHAAALEKLEQVDTLMLDKTGTLTEGKPAMALMHPLAGVQCPRPAGMGRCAGDEQRASLARAIVNAAEERKIRVPAVEQFIPFPAQASLGESAAAMRSPSASKR